MGSTSLLSMMEARMPPGFRFHPRDEELVLDYLAKRISSPGCHMMVDVDLNKVEPWDLPADACVGGKEWYFYSLRDRKYATGHRTNRATVSGYWKATGKDRPVVLHAARPPPPTGDPGSAALVGMRKTLVFYKGRAPKGKKTDWVMHEFRIHSSLDACSNEDSTSTPAAAAAAAAAAAKEDWVLCRVFYKSRAHPAKPTSAAPSVPGTATATTATTTTGDNCYDDTAGSSTAALIADALLSMEQPPEPPPPLPQHLFNLQGYEQVPCFSSILSSSSSPKPPPPIDYQTLAAFPPIRSFTQLVRLPDLSPFLSSISPENKPPTDHKTLDLPTAKDASAAFLNSHSIWS